jgi:hypothetical protein
VVRKNSLKNWPNFARLVAVYVVGAAASSHTALLIHFLKHEAGSSPANVPPSFVEGYSWSTTRGRNHVQGFPDFIIPGRAINILG